ncbi:MAG: BatA and WFA domain-containing protein [Planctomycetota bacterium]|nr:BatA and WFA domain-containing protein [Planctomycetota bacterium]
MTFLTPLLGAIAAAIAIPSLLILYFLKLRRRDLEVSTTLLWKKAIQDLQANAPFQKLRRNILLFLQLLILAAVLFALAQPQVKSESTVGDKHVILIDRSASMMSRDEQALGGGSDPITRLEAAKQQATALVERMREPSVFQPESADEAMLIVFDKTAEVRQQFTSDKRALREAIESIEAVEGPGRLTQAVQLAKAHAPRRIVEGQAIEGLTAGPVGTIHIWSDGNLADSAEAGTGPEDRVEFHQVGAPDASNVGITSLRADRAYDDPQKLSIFVAIENAGPRPASIDVELLLDGQVSGLKSATIPALQSLTPEREGDPPVRKPGTGGVVFQIDRTDGAVVQVRLRAPGSDQPPEGDVLGVDDRAWLVVPPARKLAVAVVTGGNLFLRSAIEGMSLAKADAFTPAEFDKKVQDGSARAYDIVILDSWLPTVPEGASLPPGRWLVLGTVPANVPGLEAEEAPRFSEVLFWKRDHPALRSVELSSIVFEGGRVMQIASDSAAQAIANSDRGAILADATGPDWRALIFSLDPASSRWPFDASFVVFLASAVSYLGDDAGAASGIAANLIQPGSILSDRLPDGATDVRVIQPDGETADLSPSRDGRIAFGPVRTTGVYQVTWRGQAGTSDLTDGSVVRRPFAANLMDSTETLVPAAAKLPLAGVVVAAGDSGRLALDRKLWPWLLLGALAIVMIEWYVYNRKVHL